MGFTLTNGTGEPWRWRVVRIRQCGRVRLCAERQLGGGFSGGGAIWWHAEQLHAHGNSAHSTRRRGELAR